jgi:hypothetical protein
VGGGVCAGGIIERGIGVEDNCLEETLPEPEPGLSGFLGIKWIVALWGILI